MLRGHVNGKDGIFAALLCVEMIANTGKTLSELSEEITERFGFTVRSSQSLPLTESFRQRIEDILFTQRYVPSFHKTVERVSYEDGVKVYFSDDTWCCIRFSGTEPLIRIFIEQNSEDEVNEIYDILANDDKLKLPL